METVTDFIFLGPKITAHGDCGHEIKRCLLLGKTATINPDCIKKQIHHFADKGSSAKAMVFLVVMYGCEELDSKES